MKLPAMVARRLPCARWFGRARHPDAPSALIVRRIARGTPSTCTAGNPARHPVQSASGCGRGPALRLVCLLAGFLALGGHVAAGVTVVHPPDASPAERLGAREVARYLYLRTGTLPAVQAGLGAPRSGGLVVARRDRAGLPADIATAAARLGREQYLLRTVTKGHLRILWIIGGDDSGVLYGAYRFAERLGVRFYLHGDVVPDHRIAHALPDLNEIGRPIFDVRGIQPFHDFPEGPDWWNTDDHLAYVGQLAKMRMNFLGLHCYPEGGVGPEPLVWIGRLADLDERGRPVFSYPSRWADTRRDLPWGYAAMKTSEFVGGAERLFAGDDHGPDVHGEFLATNGSPVEVCNAVFNRTAAILHRVFGFARAVGVKTCIGTETPLTIPKAVQDRLRAGGKDPNDPTVVREVYEGMFRRIALVHPLDYYWLWTPEGWTWGGNKPEQFEAARRDLEAALGALDALGKPFTLASCGWVLGPQHDRAALDAVLPKDCPMSCINRDVGHAPVERGFANVTGRPKWAIPWMENDPNLVAPQPWVGRMRQDAVDARRLGCTGLLGIHWRTKILSMNIAALAGAAWDQSWVPSGTDVSPIPPGAPPTDYRRGTPAAFTAPVEGTEEDPVYQTVRYDVDAYRLPAPNGTYRVVLKFNEPHYGEAGKRVFGVRVQGRQAIEHLDLFARAGKNRALDLTFDGVAVTHGSLVIDFTREVEYPCIAAIAATRSDRGQPFACKINCGGPRWRDYAADDGPADRHEVSGKDRSMPVEAFYIDFALAHFGPEVAESAGRVFARIDGLHLPEPSTWIDGPGGIRVNGEAWDAVAKRYGFVRELENLRDAVRGSGNLERYDYWLNTYRMMAAMAELGCRRGELDRLAGEMKKEADAAKKREFAQRGVAVRERMARLWERMIRLQVAATDTPGELGTLANLEQHNRKKLAFLTAHDTVLAAALGAALPLSCTPSEVYEGPARIIVPAVRTHAAPGEAVRLRAMVIAPDDQVVSDVRLFWREMGRGWRYHRVAFRPVGRAVFEVELPVPTNAGALEYYVTATAGRQRLVWPATAPKLNQTVVVTPLAAAPTLEAAFPRTASFSRPGRW